MQDHQPPFEEDQSQHRASANLRVSSVVYALNNKTLFLNLYKAALNLEVEDEKGIKKVINFIGNQIKNMGDKSVCFGFYSALGVYEPQKEKLYLPYSTYIIPLMKELAKEYRERLIKWFEYAFISRANEGGGGIGIKKLEKGLASFIEAIPLALIHNESLDISKFIPYNEYMVSTKLIPLGVKILNVVKSDAKKDGIVRTAKVSDIIRKAKITGLSLHWDPKSNVWEITDTKETYNLRDQLGKRGYGFEYKNGRWTTNFLTPSIKRDFEIKEQSSSQVVSTVEDWFWGTWYPKNYQRFTQVFSNYAKNLQSSYEIIFGINRKQLVKFKREIKNSDDAVEELRYRYTGRQGRDPWLSVMNEFLNLQSISPSNTNEIIKKIDLLNGMQHSNGLFIEHFPKNVFSWYVGFLNAKFSAPDPEDLARYIPDKDLKELLLFLTMSRKVRDPMGKEYWSQEPGEWHHHEKPKTDETDINWRLQQYPRYPGQKGKQLNRFDPEVQKGLKLRENR